MINKKKQKYQKVILLFFVIAVICCIADATKNSILHSREKKVYDAVNHVLTLKIKDETSYKQFCSNNGFQKVEKNWPVKANSFYVVIEDQLWGSYEGKVFFDTGEVFSILTTKREDSKDKLDSFVKLKWPDRKSGETNWNNGGN